MDNGNKIVIHKPEVELFLKDYLKKQDKEETFAYDMEKEFAKSSKKHSKTEFLLILIMIAFVLMTVFISSLFLLHSRENISVDMNVFEDINLQKMLEKFSKTESELNSALEEQDNLENEYQKTVSLLKEKFEYDNEILHNLNLKQNEFASKNQQLRSEYDLKISRIYTEYESKMKSIHKKITNLENNKSKVDLSSVKKAKTMQKKILSEKALFEEEKKQIVAEYEAEIDELNRKLGIENPASRTRKISNFSSASTDIKKLYQKINELDPLIYDKKASKIITESKYSDRQSFLKNDSNFFETKKNINQISEDSEYLSKLILETPHENSIREYVSTLHDLNLILALNATSSLEKLESSSEIINESDKFFERNLSKIDSRSNYQTTKNKFDAIETELETSRKLNRYLKKQLEKTGNVGLVIDNSNKKQILVIISPLYEKNADKSSASVFRNGEKVGNVIIHKNVNSFYIEAENQTIADNIKVDDSIVIDFIK